MGSLRALEDQRKLDRFVELKEQISMLEEEMNALREELFEALLEEPEQKVTHLGLELTIQYRSTYEYSMETQIADQELKARKKYERDAGVAAIKSQTGFIVAKRSRDF